MKKFLIGFITGGILCATITGIAVEYAVTANPYPVKVNGTETAIEGYNINDNTYFKLRDVSAAVGGFDVGFEDNTITIDTATASPVPTETPTASVDVNSDGTRKYTVDGLLIEYYEGIGYVETETIEKNYNLFLIGNNYVVDSHKKEYKITIPTHPEYVSLIPVDFYESTLYPFLLTIAE